MNTHTHTAVSITAQLVALVGSRRAVMMAEQYPASKRELLAALSDEDRVQAKQLYTELRKIEKMMMASRAPASVAAQLCQAAADGTYSDSDEPEEL